MSEREIVRLRAHASSLAAPALLLLGVAVVAWGVLRPFLRWWTTTYTLTTRRLSLRWGVLGRRGREVPLRRVVDLALRRSLLQRAVGSGTVVLQTGGDPESPRPQDVVVLRNVPQARRLYGTIGRLAASEGGGAP